MSDIGFKMTSPGYDVLLDDDPRHNVLWSKYAPLMITKYGVVQCPIINFTNEVDTNNITAIQGSGGLGEGTAESFVAQNQELSDIKIKLFKVGTPTDNVVLNITSSLGGTSLGSVSVASSSLTSGVLNTFSLSLALTLGKTYWIQATRSGSRDTSNYWAVYLSVATHPYPDGQMATLASGSWSQASNDPTSNWNFDIDYGALFTSGIVVSHGLGYAPLSLRYYDIDNNGKFWLQGTQMGLLSVESSGNGAGISDASDRDNLTFTSVITSGNEGGKIVHASCRYLLFNEPIFDPAAGGDKPAGYSTNDVGFKISAPGKDVRTAKLYDQLVNSNCDFLKFHATKVLKISFNTTSNGQTTADFDHNLGYVPAFLAWGYFDTLVEEKPLPINVVGAFSMSAYADTDRIRVEITWAGAPSPSTVNAYARIVIFKNNMLG